MISVRYVSDGERDRRMLPPLVASIIGEHHVAAFTSWREIQLQGGFGGGRLPKLARKLRLEVLRAEQDGHAVVATVDEDGDPSRVVLIQQWRDDHAGGVPVAVGHAVPHGEAWLLDDLDALHSCGLRAATAPRPRGEPKREFEALVRAAGLDMLDAFERVAAALQAHRCQRARETGFADFVEDVRTRLLGPP